MRKSRMLSCLVATLLVAALVPAAPASARVGALTAPVGTAFQLTTSTFPDIQEEFQGDMVVYSSSQTPGEDVWGVDVTTGKPFLIATGGGAQNNPSVYGDIVVYHDSIKEYDGSSWQESADIMGYKLSTGEEFPICTAPDEQGNPFIWGDWVVWVDHRDSTGSNCVMAKNLKTSVETTVGWGPGNQRCAGLYGTKVAYKDEGMAGQPIVVKDVSTNTTTAIINGGLGYKYSVNIYGPRVVWTESNDVYVHNYETSSTTILSTTGYQCAEIYDTTVVWADTRNGDSDIYKWNLTTDTTASVVATGVDNYQARPRMWGNTIVWTDHRNDSAPGEDDNPDMYAMYLARRSVEISGTDRYNTSVAISRKQFPEGADTVIVATGQNWPDALAASALAGAYNSPILLVESDMVPAAVYGELARLNAKHAIIIGGTSAVSSAVQSALDAALTGTITRYAGADRFATASKVASAACDKSGVTSPTALVATGRAFPDAVGASALAAGLNMPLYLVETGSVPSGVMTQMKADGVSNVYVVGGASAVASSVITALDAQFGTIERLSGADRYGTALAVADKGVALGLHYDGIAFATGTNYPDALCGGVMQGLQDSVLVLTPGNDLYDPLAAKLTAQKANIGIYRFLGGTGAITTAVRNEVKALLP